MEPPETAATWDELVQRLVCLRLERGAPSYGELATRIGEVRRARGRAHAQPGRTTVYDLFRPGRSRVDVELFLDAVAALGVDGAELTAWTRSCTAVAGRGGGAPGTTPGNAVGGAPGDVTRARRGVPVWDGPFVGRQEELADLRARTGNGVVALAVSGLGGSGKSRLASAFLQHLRDHGRVEELITVDVRGHDAELRAASPGAVARAALKSLSEPVGSEESAVAALVEVLERRAVGLLLDDAATVEGIAELVPRRGRSVIVMTTRLRADHPRLRCFPLGGMSEAEARELLATDIGAERLATDPAATDRLVELGGGLPLALHLLAARVSARPDWSLADLAEQASRLRATQRLEQRLASAVASAYAAVAPEARSMLRQLASQPCSSLDLDSLGRMVELTPDVALGVADTLAAAHLVEVSAGDSGSRASLHDVVRTYVLGVAEQVDPPSQRDASLERLCAHLVERVWSCSATIGPVGLVLSTSEGTIPRLRPETTTDLEPDAARAWLAANTDSLLELAAACVVRRPRVTVALAPVVAAWLHSCWRLADAAWLLDQARHAAHVWGDPEMVAEMRFARGSALLWTAQPRHALDDLAVAADVLSQLGRSQTRAAVLGAQALANRYAGELETAVEQSLEAIHLLEVGREDRVHRWWTAISALTMLGREAEADLLEASMPAADLDGGDSAAFDACYRCEDLLIRRRWDDALREAERGLRLLETVSVVPGTLAAYAEMLLAGARIHTGGAVQAVTMLEEALPSTRSAGDQQLEVFGLTLHGRALLEVGRLDEAERVLDQGRRLAIRLANPVAEADCLEVLASCHDRVARPLEALRCRQDADELWVLMGSTRRAQVEEDEAVSDSA